MDSKEFLALECENVARTLKETLRHDYGPIKSEIFYRECKSRLKWIQEKLSSSDSNSMIVDLRIELAKLSSWIYRIEQSRLGEVSWPFANIVQDIATELLSEQAFDEDTTRPPLINVIATGGSYHIYSERVRSPGSIHRTATIAFPRSLKHHVLLHVIFGHELGHVVADVDLLNTVNSKVIRPLTRKGPISDRNTLTDWVRQASLGEIKDVISRTGPPTIDEDNRLSWVSEFFCDLFGLCVFGPAYVAALKALLQGRRPKLNVTHPVYALRQRLLVIALRLLGWDEPILAGCTGPAAAAEAQFLAYICDDPGGAHASLFDDDQVQEALDGLREIVSVAQFSYSIPEPMTFEALVKRLEQCLPPISERIDEEGRPEHNNLFPAQVLHAGWAFWIGRNAMSPARPLDFLETNRLCELGLLQLEAIKLVHGK